MAIEFVATLPSDGQPLQRNSTKSVHEQRLLGGMQNEGTSLPEHPHIPMPVISQAAPMVIVDPPLFCIARVLMEISFVQPPGMTVPEHDQDVAHVSTFPESILPEIGMPAPQGAGASVVSDPIDTCALLRDGHPAHVKVTYRVHSHDVLQAIGWSPVQLHIPAEAVQEAVRGYMTPKYSPAASTLMTPVQSPAA